MLVAARSMTFSNEWGGGTEDQHVIRAGDKQDGSMSETLYFHDRRCRYLN